jgi:hypothetical protein
MASKIAAIRAYGPRIELGKAAQEDDYLDLVTRNTGVSRGTVKHVQEEDVEALIYLLKQGHRVRTGSAIYTPTVKLDGRIEVKVSVRRDVEDKINVVGEFTGTLANAENVGKTTEKLFDQWDADHPADPVAR